MQVAYPLVHSKENNSNQTNVLLLDYTIKLFLSLSGF